MRVYDKHLNLLTETQSYQSLQFTRSFHGIGEFEIHINKYLQGAEHFNKGNIISLGQPHKTGIIVTKEIALDESGKASENIKLTGTTLKGLIERRITVPPSDTSHDRKKGDAETVMKHYIDKHFYNPSDNDRRFKRFRIATNKRRGSDVNWESRYKNIADEIEKISKDSGLGWEVYADFASKEFVFDVVECNDLSQENSDGNNPVFFSPEFETVKSQSLIDSDNDLRNFGYVGGQGEGVERKIIKIGDNKGFDRIETFVDARDIGSEGEDDEELTESEQEKLLVDRGKDKMKEKESLLSFEAEILTPVTRKSYEYTHEGYRHPGQPVGKMVAKSKQITPFEYERDFNLGDIVDVVNKSWGVTLFTPIVEITEIHEQGGYKIEAVFGEDRPTLISKLNRKFSDLDNVEKHESSVKESKEYTRDKIEEQKPSTGALWEGAVYLKESHTIKPEKKLSECVNGWVLRWQRYKSGDGLGVSNFQYTFIPKIHVKYENGRGMREVLVAGSDGTQVDKYFYVYDDKIEGFDDNGKDDNKRIAISGVFEW